MPAHPSAVELQLLPSTTPFTAPFTVVSTTRGITQTRFPPTSGDGTTPADGERAVLPLAIQRLGHLPGLLYLTITSRAI